MVTPDYTAYDQDRAPGLIRELHDNLSTRQITFRNQPLRDYDQLVKTTRLLSVQCDDGYVIGLPYGRHLRLFYEFDTINHIRLHLTNLLNDIGELALQHSECEVMTLDYNDFPHRHYVEPMLIGAAFPSPDEVSVMRCRDIREQSLPEINADVSVRQASEDDAEIIAELEQSAAGEAAHAPPLSPEFFGSAAWVGIAELDGRPAGYIHLSEAEKRGLAAEELVIAADQPFAEISGALLAAAMSWGAEQNRRGLTLRVAGDAVGDPMLADFGFRHVTNELFYQRPADPAVIRRQRDEQVVTRVKVGKIWGASRMRIAQRVQSLPPYLFVEISRRIAEQREKGVRVISFGIGDPDLPTHPHILEALHNHIDVPANHRYPETEGLPELRQAIATWMQQRFEVALDPASEIVPLIGAKEGIANTALCFIDPGDIALVPDPAYPVYAIGTMFAGGTSHHLPLTAENDWLPDLDAIPADVREQARVLWINYPNNPTGATAEIDFFQHAAEFGLEHDIAVLHDNAYCDVTFDGYDAPAYLQAAGAREAGIEYFSLSKSFNMTGWRVGWACGNAEMVDALLRVKSNIDSGIPQAIQQMAIAALLGDQSVIEANNAIIERRRDKVVAALRAIGLEVTNPKASLYIWARIPGGDSSAGFASRLIEEQGVVVTPGNGYGASGEGYIRLSLTLPDAEVDEGVERIAAFTSG